MMFSPKSDALRKVERSTSPGEVPLTERGQCKVFGALFQLSLVFLDGVLQALEPSEYFPQLALKTVKSIPARRPFYSLSND